MSILERRKAKVSTMILAAPIAALAVSGLASSAAHGSPIGSSDLLFYQAGTGNGTGGTIADGNAGTPFLIDDLNTANNTLVQQFNVTALTGNNNAANSTTLYVNSNGSNGQLAISDNNTLVTFGGYQGSSANELNQTVRQAAALDASGNLTTAATYNSSANGQIRSAYSADGTNYLFADKVGIFTGNSSAPAVATNIRYLAGFGGTTFALAQGNSSTPSFYTYSAGTLTPVAGIGNSAFSNGTDFVFLQSGNNGTAYDTLYVADGTSILKYDYDGTTLTPEGSDAVTGLPGNVVDLTAVEAGNNTVNIFFTTKSSGSVAGTVEEAIDTAGWNSPLVNTSASVLYTAPSTGIDFFGISTAPVAVPEPVSASLLGLTGLALLGRRRRAVAR